MRQPLGEALPLPPGASLHSFLPPSLSAPRPSLTPKIPFPFPFKWLPSRQHESKKTEHNSTKGNMTSGCIPTLKFCRMKLLLEGVLLLLQESNQMDHYLGLVYQKLRPLLEFVSQFSHSKRRRV